MRVTTLRATLALSTSVLACLVGATASQAAAPCTMYASPNGSDSAPGTEAAPFATAQQLSESLQPGDVGCLRNGTYNENLKVHDGGTASAPVTIRSYPGERATVVGRMWVARGADFVTISDLNIDGKNPSLLPSPTVNASDTTFDDVDVTNDHTAICFNLGSDDWGRAVRTIIENSRIHDCGVIPSINTEHGIYISAGNDDIIRNNVIYDNADRGIQLYPDSQHTTITGNVIDGNGEGIIFSGAGDASSDDNVVTGNIITNSNIRSNVESWYPTGTPSGTGNVVTGNCVFGGGSTGGISNGSGFTATANIVADPQYVNAAAGDYRLRTGSPCAAVLSGTMDPTVASASANPGPVPPATPSTTGSKSKSSGTASSTPGSTSTNTSSNGSGNGSTVTSDGAHATTAKAHTKRRTPLAHVAVIRRRVCSTIVVHHHGFDARRAYKVRSHKAHSYISHRVSCRMVSFRHAVLRHKATARAHARSHR